MVYTERSRVSTDGAGKNMVKKLDNISEAISFFKEQKGNSELAIGKDEKREQFLKEPKIKQSLNQGKSQSKDKELAESKVRSV
jgi:hypothetical protein